jgi:cytochrome c oxidase subunit IV
MSDHVVPRGVYFAVFGALLVLTSVTVFVAFFDLGPLNTIAAISIACTKALLVVLYFMHVRYGGSLVRVVIGASILWIVILLVLLMGDYASRGWLPYPGK